MIRAFLAFDIPEKTKKVLGRIVEDFSSKESGVKWIPASNMHVTMKFFGDIDEELLLGPISEKIAETLKSEKKIILDCAGIGVFPDWKYPKVIWAGFIGDVEPVITLQHKLEKNLKEFKIKKDARTFRLHLTIGRAKELKNKNGLIHLIDELGPIKFGEVLIDHLTLYKSVLTKEGSVYTPLKRFEI